MKISMGLLFMAVLIVTLSFSSCRRCTQCTVLDKDTGDVITVSPEFCGNKEDVMKFRDAYVITYGSAADVVCD